MLQGQGDNGPKVGLGMVIGSLLIHGRGELGEFSRSVQ